MGENADGTRIIFDNLTNTLNATGDAFNIVEESISQKLDKSFAKLTNDTLPFFQNILFGTTAGLTGFVSILKIPFLFKSLNSEVR